MAALNEPTVGTMRYDMSGDKLYVYQGTDKGWCVVSLDPTVYLAQVHYAGGTETLGAYSSMDKGFEATKDYIDRRLVRWPSHRRNDYLAQVTEFVVDKEVPR